jgi:5-methylcytosine-specific restriction endonuclease McrA
VDDKVKKQLVEYKGGSCVLCGYKKCLAALHFHHINPFEKNFAISEKATFSKEVIEELEKCVLLCSNCHFSVHAGIVDLELLVDLAED